MDDNTSQSQQYAYSQPLVQQAIPTVESASATTDDSANTSGPAAYIVLAIMTVLLCVFLTQAGRLAGGAFGEVMGELYEEYGDEFSLEEYEEFQSQLEDDPVSPDFGEILDGETENA